MTSTPTHTGPESVSTAGAIAGAGPAAQAVGRPSGRPGRRSSVPRPGDRLPAPPRQRRPALAALAVLLVFGGAALAGLLALRVDQRVSVLVARRDIPVGQRITPSDVAVGRIAAEGVAVVKAEQTDLVVGQYATQSIRAKQLIDATMVDRSGFLRPGSVAVGVPMNAGRVPAQGLEVGDVVRVLRVPKAGAPSVLVERAAVSQTTLQADAGRGLTGDSPGSSVADGNQAATLVVTSEQANQVAATAAANEITLVLLERGATTKPGQD
jgi:Flp pilus assembly protein CpaB